MTHHRKGWLRLAAVLSVAWLIVVSIYTGYESRLPFFEQSIFFEPQPDALTFLRTEVPTPVHIHFRTSRFIGVTLLPMVALWILVLLVIPAIGWVYDGFKA